MHLRAPLQMRPPGNTQLSRFVVEHRYYPLSRSSKVSREGHSRGTVAGKGPSDGHFQGYNGLTIRGASHVVVFESRGAEQRPA